MESVKSIINMLEENKQEKKATATKTEDRTANWTSYEIIRKLQGLDEDDE